MASQRDYFGIRDTSVSKQQDNNYITQHSLADGSRACVLVEEN